MFILEYPEFSHQRDEVLNEVIYYKLKAIDGTLIKNSICTGYCCSDIHPGYLSNALVQQHGCKIRKCPSFYKRIKNVNKPFGLSEEAQVNLHTAMQEMENLELEIKRFNHDGCMRVCDVSSNSLSVYSVKYAYPASIDEAELKEKMEQLFGVKILLERVEFKY